MFILQTVSYVFSSTLWLPYSQLQSQASGNNTSSTPPRKAQSSGPKVRKSVSSRVHEAVTAIALCHNVTPVYESRAGTTGETEYAEVDQDFSDENRTYQASSPDEVSRPFTESRFFVLILRVQSDVGWCVSVGLKSMSMSSFRCEQGSLRIVLMWRTFCVCRWGWTTTTKKSIIKLICPVPI